MGLLPVTFCFETGHESEGRKRGQGFLLLRFRWWLVGASGLYVRSDAGTSSYRLVLGLARLRTTGTSRGTPSAIISSYPAGARASSSSSICEAGAGRFFSFSAGRCGAGCSYCFANSVGSCFQPSSSSPIAPLSSAVSTSSVGAMVCSHRSSSASFDSA